MDPEYVTGQIDSHTLELLLRRFCRLILAPSWKSYYALVDKVVPNKRKRYSSHLPASIMHWVAPIKVYFTIYDSLKNSFLKKVFVPQ